MADYHALISRAVAGLEHNTGENRRVLYERARAALLNQLRGVDPPLEEADVTRERLSLEEAIRRVEADTAKQALPEDVPGTPEHQPAPPNDPGISGFRETVAEADHLGGAAAQAHRSAREFYDHIPDQVAGPVPGQVPDHVPDRARALGGERPPSRSTRYFEPMDERARVSEPDLTDEAPPPPPPARDLPEGRYGQHEDYAPRVQRSWGRLGLVILFLVVIAGIAGTAYWQREQISSLVASLRNTAAPTPRQTEGPATRPKIADRIGEDNAASKSATAPASAVAQKVVLYDEDPADPKGKRFVGSAIWRTETVSPGSGLAPELAVRADVEIPERHMRMTWSMRRNTDKALPASHTIEIQFTLPADFDQGGIGNVPGVLMKSGEEARGVPLAGLAVKVTNGYFLIGLSSLDIDKQRNIQMLKDRDWLDIPIVYTSGRRAILSVEKGAPGQRAFEEALRAWGE
jgi:hypothetical protein